MRRRGACGCCPAAAAYTLRTGAAHLHACRPFGVGATVRSRATQCMLGTLMAACAAQGSSHHTHSPPSSTSIITHACRCDAAPHAPARFEHCLILSAVGSLMLRLACHLSIVPPRAGPLERADPTANNCHNRRLRPPTSSTGQLRTRLASQPMVQHGRRQRLCVLCPVVRRPATTHQRHLAAEHGCPPKDRPQKDRPLAYHPRWIPGSRLRLSGSCRPRHPSRSRWLSADSSPRLSGSF
jgi:hypothetical protein